MSSPSAVGPTIEALECPICIDEMSTPEDLSTTICMHTFHKNCIFSALNSTILADEKANCPLCRRDQKLESAREKITELCDLILDKDLIGAKYLLTDPEVQRNINIINTDDMHTALYVAIDNDADAEDIIDPLLDVGALLTVASPGKPAAKIVSPIALACIKSEEIVTKILGLCSKEQLNELHGEFGSALNTFMEMQDEAEWDAVAVVDILLKRGADINLTNTKMNVTPLHKAVVWQSDELFNRLIQGGPNPNILANGISVLATAIAQGKIAYIQPLIDLRADIALCSNGELSALQFACFYNIEALEILLQSCTPEQLNLQNENCDSALNTILQHSDQATVSKTEVIKRIIKGGANLDLCSLKTGLAPIHHAVREKADNGLLLFLLQKGANANVLTSDGNSALNMAVRTGNIEFVWPLIEYNAHLDPEILQEIAGKEGFDEMTRILTDYQTCLEYSQEGSPAKKARN